MSAPRSKRIDASVFRPSRLLVRRTDAGSKYALSSAIARGRRPNLGVAPPITPAIAARALGVGDDQHVGVERAVDAVERRAAVSPGARAADHERRPAEPLEIERVHRLPELEHHVVGDVDDVADRADAGRLEPVAQPVAATGATVTSNTCAQ